MLLHLHAARARQVRSLRARVPVCQVRPVRYGGGLCSNTVALVNQNAAYTYNGWGSSQPLTSQKMCKSNSSFWMCTLTGGGASQ